MSVYREVLVGSDGSPTAQRAVASAGRLAAALGVPVTVATSWRRDLPDGPSAAEEMRYPGGGAAGTEAMWASETVADAAAVLRRAGATEVHTRTPQGSPADALLALSDDRPGSLLVVGSRGLDQRSERWVGNVPHQLTHHCRRDLLLARSTVDDEPGWRRIALATDGSATAALALEHGLALCRALDVTPTLLTVADDGAAGERTLDGAATAAPDAAREVVAGRDARGLLVEAAARYDLLVLGNKGMSGPSRLLGSIANHVTHEVPTDLLLVNTTR